VWNNPSSSNDSTEPAAASTSSNRRLASLGPSITIKGDLSGGEDLLIEGSVEGQVSVPKHGVTVGKSGRVTADVYSKTIVVEGEVKGNLFGDENVVVRQSGRVEGNIKAPRVSLEGGSTFRGSIDMEPGTTVSTPTPASKTQKSEGRNKGGRENRRPEGKKPVVAATS